MEKFVKANSADEAVRAVYNQKYKHEGDYVEDSFKIDYVLESSC